MKINISKIKRWDLKERLEQIERRLDEVDNWSELQPSIKEEIDEILQIIKFWKREAKKEKKNDNAS